jgi:4-hydroxy-tetrahydrodipicolinate synthase
MEKNWKNHPWAGVFPATLCAFRADESMDEEGLRSYFAELASVEGIKGLTCNGHTGEIMSLRPNERARVTRVLAKTLQETNRKTGRTAKAISGVSAEGSLEAIDHALAAKEAGADAILLMPPHHWLRFGRSSQTAVGFFQDVAVGADLPIVVHQYPAWTKAGYSLAEMLEIVKIPRVVCIKMGTRDMARWLYDYEKLKEAAPHVTIITCHDEFLLPTLLEGADGALIGFAGFVPELMVELVHAALDGDLSRARRAQQTVAPLARIIYDFGEPGCGAHQRMKVARWLMGKFPSPHFRRPVRPLPPEKIQDIRRRLEEIGLACPITGGGNSVTI